MTMRAPVKLNRAFWPSWLTRVLPSAADPRVLSGNALTGDAFSDAVSTFRFGRTFKTTEKARFPECVAILSSLKYEVPPVILDVGASDGITSVDVMKAVPFERYIVSDAHMTVFTFERGGRTYYYDADRRCILIATDAWVVYQSTDESFPALGSIARAFHSRAPELAPDSREITLINPAVKAELTAVVSTCEYDILQQWSRGNVDLVIAANILNRSYFSEDELITAARNLIEALRGDGRLVVIENRDREKATIFRVAAGRASVEHRLNGGSEIEQLIRDRALPGGPTGSEASN
jgi:hypothetical protein